MPALTAAERAGRFGTVQLVAVELAVVALGAITATDSPVAAALFVVAAGALLGGALGRLDGRWMYEAVAAHRRLRRRRRAAEARAAGARAAGGERQDYHLMPDLVIRTVADRGTAIGIGQDGAGWFAAMAIVPPDELLGGRVAVRLDVIARALGDASALQVVTRSVPEPPGGPDVRTPCARSYRELARTLTAPAYQQAWLAVRLSAREGAHAAAARGGGATGVHRALSAVLSRVGAALTATGLSHRVLDGDGLRDALTVSCGLEPGRPPAPERWSGWVAGDAVNICFAVRRWPADPPADPPTGLLAALAEVPAAAAVTTAVIFRPSGMDGERVAVRTLVRVTAPADRVALAVKQLLTTAHRLGVRLTRLDGEQAIATYSTAPTGGILGAVPW